MIWLLLAVCGALVIIGPGWVEALEQRTLADLLEQMSGEKYLETIDVSVATGKDQSFMHFATIGQSLFTFYSYGHRFVKFKVASQAFSSIHWLPDPNLTPDKTHFKIVEVYGHKTSNTDCPSLSFV